MLSPVVRETIVGHLERRISDDILAGRYPPGSLLPPERDFARDYDVTRTTLKHTLIRLEQAGLIETRHGVGSVVRDFEVTAGLAILPLLVRAGSEGWLGEVAAARRLVGCLIAREAATHRSAADLEDLRELVASLREAEPGSEAQLVEAAIHRVLARASGNRIFVLLANSLLDVYLSVGEHLQAPFADPRRLAAGIEKVVDEVARRDGAAADRAAERYLARTGKAMFAGFGETEG